MIPAIIIICLWLMIGLYSISLENVENDFIVNVPFIVFLSIIPLLPWIFHACGL